MFEVPFKNYVFAALGLNFIAIFGVILSQRFLPPQIPLFYGLPQSDTQLTGSLTLIAPSILSILVIALNSALSSFTKDEFLKKILIAASIFTTILSFVATVKIILLVGSF